MRVRGDSVHGNGSCKLTVGGVHLASGGGGLCVSAGNRALLRLWLMREGSWAAPTGKFSYFPVSLCHPLAHQAVGVYLSNTPLFPLLYGRRVCFYG